MKRIIPILIAILVCFGVGCTASYFQSESILNWYPALEKPSCTPPDIVFSNAKRFINNISKVMAKIIADSDIPIDDDMKERIRMHQERRDPEWGTYEGYRDLGEVVKNTEKNTILLDCVTVMITNILFEEEERDFDKISASEVEKLESEVIKELTNLVKAIRDEDKTLIIVSNEVGMSIVPSYRLGRIFSDISGKANQVLASLSDEVYVAISGLPLRLK